MGKASRSTNSAPSVRRRVQPVNRIGPIAHLHHRSPPFRLTTYCVLLRLPSFSERTTKCRRSFHKPNGALIGGRICMQCQCGDRQSSITAATAGYHMTKRQRHSSRIFRSIITTTPLQKDIRPTTLIKHCRRSPIRLKNWLKRSTKLPKTNWPQRWTPSRKRFGGCSKRSARDPVEPMRHGAQGELGRIQTGTCRFLWL